MTQTTPKYTNKGHIRNFDTPSLLAMREKYQQQQPQTLIPVLMAAFIEEELKARGSATAYLRAKELVAELLIIINRLDTADAAAIAKAFDNGLHNREVSQ